MNDKEVLSSTGNSFPSRPRKKTHNVISLENFEIERFHLQVLIRKDYQENGPIVCYFVNYESYDHYILQSGH